MKTLQYTAFLIRVGILLLPTQIGKLTIYVGKKNAEANFFDYMTFLFLEAPKIFTTLHHNVIDLVAESSKVQ